MSGLHDLFVKGDKGNAVTIALLKEVLGMVRGLVRFGVRVLIHRMSPEMLQSDEVLDSLRTKLGIEALPAMVSDRGEVLTGTDEILGYLSSLLRKGAAAAGAMPRRNASPDTGGLEASFESFALSTMNEGDDPVDDGAEEMMKRYHNKLQSSTSASPRGAPRRPMVPAGGATKEPAPVQGHSRDNSHDTSIKEAYGDNADCDGQDIDLLEKMMANIGYET